MRYTKVTVTETVDILDDELDSILNAGAADTEEDNDVDIYKVLNDIDSITVGILDDEDIALLRCRDLDKVLSRIKK